MNYNEFLNSKVCIAEDSGFDVTDDEISPALKPHQREAVKWACKGGRRALFELFGLGKTIQELEFCRLVIKHKGGKALIVLPLGVKQEFTNDAVNLLNMPAPIYVRNMAEIEAAEGNILMTNYERLRDGDIDPTVFTAVCLDEASVLRSFGSKTYQTFLPKFKGIKYKLVATATPDPNKYKEIIHYAGYLEIMDTGQALTRYFQRDSTKANNLTLYPHKEKEFWLWVSSWALFLSSPADLGFDATGYELPPIDIRYHKLPAATKEVIDKKTGQVSMLTDAAAGLASATKEKRDSLDSRVACMADIVNGSPDDHFILWHDLEAERHAIKQALPQAVEVYGTQDLDKRERNVIDFAEGRIRLLATKKEISGQGCNFQKHCHRAIFVGIDYKFNDFMSGNNFETSMGVPRSYIEMYRKLDISADEHRLLQGINHYVSTELFMRFKSIGLFSFDYKNVVECCKYQRLDTLCDYIERLNDTSLYGASRVVSWLKDYYDMCDALEVPITKTNVRPRELKKSHDLLVERYNKVKAAIKDAKSKAALELVNNWFKGYEKDGLCILVPQYESDFIREGQALNHCVGNGSYYKKHITGEKMIFFIRKTENEKVPYFTAEIDMVNNKVLQCYGKGDCRPTNNVDKFIKEFNQWLKYQSIVKQQAC